MKVSDRYRRAVVGLGSAALASTLGLGVHFVAGDPIGLRAGDLVGGDALAAAQVAQPLDRAVEGGKLPDLHNSPPEEPASSDPRREFASDENSASVSGEDQPPGHAGAAAARPTDDSPAGAGDEASADEPSPAHAPAAQAEEGLAAPSSGSSTLEPGASADPEPARVSWAGEVESDGAQTAPPEAGSEHPPESHEPEDDPSYEDE